MKDITNKYSNGEVTIVWQPHICIHSTRCWKGTSGLKDVFNPAKRPWIEPAGASTGRIIEQIKKCPSGALNYYMNNNENQSEQVNAQTVIEAAPNGPLLVHGDIILKDKGGNEIRKSKMTAFCRCGASANKPYCDGSHRKIEFKD